MFVKHHGMAGNMGWHEVKVKVRRPDSWTDPDGSVPGNGAHEPMSTTW